jgi:hypothetical protein
LKRYANRLLHNATAAAATSWIAARTAITTAAAANNQRLQGQQLPRIRSAAKRPLHGRATGAAQAKDSLVQRSAPKAVT